MIRDFGDGRPGAVVRKALLASNRIRQGPRRAEAGSFEESANEGSEASTFDVQRKCTVRVQGGGKHSQALQSTPSYPIPVGKGQKLWVMTGYGIRELAPPKRPSVPYVKRLPARPSTADMLIFQQKEH